MKRKARYCITLTIALLVGTFTVAATQVVEGETGSGAKYLLEVPDSWNGDLVVYAHGIVDASLPIALPTVDDIEPLRGLLTSNGYAVDYSSYSKNGFAVREGVLDTHALNHQFIQRFGQPERTFLVGYSLGGAVCVRLAEFFPQQYDGILTVAGMLGGSQAEIDYVANVRILWEFFYPGVLPGAIDNVPPVDVVPDIVIPIVTAITIDPTGAGAIALIDQTPVPWDFVNGAELVESYATAIGFWYTGYNDVVERTGKKGFYDNSGTVYTSSLLPSPVIDGINGYAERFEGSNQAARYLWRHYEPSGELAMPHLALHNERDPAVPVFHQALYAEAVAEQGDSDQLVQRVEPRYGHTGPFKADEVFGAFEELVDWVDTGAAPVP